MKIITSEKYSLKDKTLYKKDLEEFDLGDLILKYRKEKREAS